MVKEQACHFSLGCLYFFPDDYMKTISRCFLRSEGAFYGVMVSDSDAVQTSLPAYADNLIHRYDTVSRIFGMNVTVHAPYHVTTIQVSLREQLRGICLKDSIS